uniref:Uncharacterized protein n=1 Tax=Scleropages formosus TaxID=113540 RepID=A0A8C9S935_SCLFO
SFNCVSALRPPNAALMGTGLHFSGNPPNTRTSSCDTSADPRSTEPITGAAVAATTPRMRQSGTTEVRTYLLTQVSGRWAKEWRRAEAAVVPVPPATVLLSAPASAS